MKGNEKVVMRGVHIQPPRYLKDDFLGMAQSITVEIFKSEIEGTCEELQMVLNELCFTGEFHLAPYLDLARYAIDGDSSCLLAMATELKTGRGADLAFNASVMLGLHELMGAFEEYHSGINQSPALLLVMNMFWARIEIDKSRLGSDLAYSISISEISLLAKMKPGSVRNYAVKGHAHYLPTTEGEHVSVKAENAHKWLLERKGYVPTVLPKKKSERDALRLYLDDC